MSDQRPYLENLKQNINLEWWLHCFRLIENIFFPSVQVKEILHFCNCVHIHIEIDYFIAAVISHT